MVSKKGKGIVPSSNLDLVNNDAANTSKSETGAYSQMKMNGIEAGVASGSKEVMNEENAIMDMEDWIIGTEEEKNEETAIVDEDNEDNEMEEDKYNKLDPIEEEDNEQNAAEGEDNDEVEDKDEEENEVAAEDIDEEENEVAGEDNDEEENMVVGEEEKGEENENNTVEQEEDKLGVNSNERVKRSRKRSRNKKMQEEEVEEEEEDGEGEGEGNEESAPKQEEERVGANSKEKIKRKRKRSRKNKLALTGSEALATKSEDKPESSSKKKGSKRAESMGMIFMCSSKTKKDCYRYKVLGLPASKRDLVEKIYKGMRLFLFDFDLRLMYGIYKAAGPGGYNIEPKAFKSAFPSQVRFTVLDDCLPLAEEKFKTVIKENYYGKNKFDCQLTSKQVKSLCKLFLASTKSSKSEKLSRNARPETRTRVDRDRIRRQRSPDEDRRSARSALVVDRRRHGRPIRYERERVRQRSLDDERHSALVADRRRHDHPIMYERETFAVSPLHRLPPLPPPTAIAPSYASYGRTLEMDAYRRDSVIERRDPRLLDLDLRYQDEFGSRDPYISYRELPLYHDPLYSAVLPPEYNPPAASRGEYRLAAPLSEYRRPGAPSSEYGRLRPLYRY